MTTRTPYETPPYQRKTTIIKPPIGCLFIQNDESWTLNKTLYSLQYSPIHWFEKLTSTLKNTGLKSSPHDPYVCTGSLIPGRVSNLHWPIRGWLCLVHRIWLNGRTVSHIPIIHATSWLSWGYRLVYWHLIWMFQWRPRQYISPSLPVGIRWTYIRTLWPRKK